MQAFAINGAFMSQGLSKEEQEAAFERAIDKWLDKQFAKFGKWSLAAIGATALVLLLMAAVKLNVWQH